MALFFKKPGIGENRIENSGRWPVRLTQFQLVDDYEFPATNFPEIFFVRAGSFVHESEAGIQSLREGHAMMVHPGRGHSVRQPEEAVLVRVRFLPEWLACDYELIVRSPGIFSLFFDQSWLHHPREEKLHVFTTRGEGTARVVAELDFLRDLLRERRQLEPVARIAVLKLMALLADEHRRFWRGADEFDIPPAVVHALDQVESCILRAEAFDPAKMPRGGFTKRALEKAFLSLAGMTLPEYALRRRAFHAAFRLLATMEEPRRISKALGWPGVADFRTQFRSVFDVEPLVYREKFGIPSCGAGGLSQAQ